MFVIAPLIRLLSLFRRETRGNIAVITALALVPLVGLTGAAVDFGMAFYARQRLDAAAHSAVAAAIAQGRALRSGRANAADFEYETRGRARAESVFNAQKPSVRNVSMSFAMVRGATPNTFNINLDYEAFIGSVFLRLVGMTELKVQGSASASWVMRDAVIDERFEDYRVDVRAAGARAYSAISGWSTNGLASAGSAQVLRLSSTDLYPGMAPPADVRVALELDTGVGNASISRKFSAEPGTHQIRYWYRDLSVNDRIAPAWLCGTRLEDVDWMKYRDEDPASDTNIISVHLTADSGNAPPASVNLGDANRIDACYHSGSRWIQRAIKIDIVTRGDYWITFRAEGRADGVSGAISNLLVCRDPCANDDGKARAAPDNSPWAANQLLFNEPFTTAGADPIRNSPGSSGGWSSLPKGWVTWPLQTVTYAKNNVTGEGHVALDIANDSGGYTNQSMARPFLFPPGYYSLRYSYSVGSSASGRDLCSYFGVKDSALVSTGSVDPATNRVVASIDSDLGSLHPEAGVAGSPVVFLNATKGARTTSAVAKVPFMLSDDCVDQPDGVMAQREITFNIVRAGLYWVTFAAGGVADGQGGRISRVELRVLRVGDGNFWSVIREDRRAGIPEVGSWAPMPVGTPPAQARFKVQVQ